MSYVAVTVYPHTMGSTVLVPCQQAWEVIPVAEGLRDEMANSTQVLE